MKLDFGKMNIEELLSLTDIIKERGDLLFIKLDGEREANHFTVVVSYASKTNKDAIRREGNNLIDLLSEVLKNYYKENNL